MQAGVSLLILDVMPMWWSLPGYRHNYLKFYRSPNSNMFTHRLLFFSREATSETYGPRVSFHHICLCGLFSFAFTFRSIKPKIKKYLAAIYLFRDLFILSTTFTSRYLPILRRRTPEGIDNPFNTSGCEDLLSVCRGCLRCVAWFSYWFDNLGFISEGNTYRRCDAYRHSPSR